MDTPDGGKFVTKARFQLPSQSADVREAPAKLFETFESRDVWSEIHAFVNGAGHLETEGRYEECVTPQNPAGARWPRRCELSPLVAGLQHGKRLHTVGVG